MEIIINLMLIAITIIVISCLSLNLNDIIEYKWDKRNDKKQWLKQNKEYHRQRKREFIYNFEKERNINDLTLNELILFKKSLYECKTHLSDREHGCRRDANILIKKIDIRLQKEHDRQGAFIQSLHK